MQCDATLAPSSRGSHRGPYPHLHAVTGVTHCTLQAGCDNGGAGRGLHFLPGGVGCLGLPRPWRRLAPRGSRAACFRHACVRTARSDVCDPSAAQRVNCCDTARELAGCTSSPPDTAETMRWQPGHLESESKAVRGGLVTEERKYAGNPWDIRSLFSRPLNTTHRVEVAF